MQWRAEPIASIVSPMIDPLLARAQLAIEESHSTREQRRLLRAELNEMREKLRLVVFDIASLRMEIRAHRENRG
jgi:hypothetical protein